MFLFMATGAYYEIGLIFGQKARVKTLCAHVCDVSYAACHLTTVNNENIVNAVSTKILRNTDLVDDFSDVFTGDGKLRESCA